MLRYLQRRLASFGLDHVEAPFFALLAQRPAHQALVVYHQYLFRGHSKLIYYESQRSAPERPLAVGSVIGYVRKECGSAGDKQIVCHLRAW